MIVLRARAQQLDMPRDWLIRSHHDRALPEGAKPWSAASEGEAIGKIVFTAGSRHGVKARQVRQHVRLRRIELPADKGQTVTARTCSPRPSSRPGRSSTRCFA